MNARRMGVAEGRMGRSFSLSCHSFFRDDVPSQRLRRRERGSGERETWKRSNFVFQLESVSLMDFFDDLGQRVPVSHDTDDRESFLFVPETIHRLRIDFGADRVTIFEALVQKWRDGGLTSRLDTVVGVLVSMTGQASGGTLAVGLAAEWSMLSDPRTREFLRRLEYPSVSERALQKAFPSRLATTVTLGEVLISDSPKIILSAAQSAPALMEKDVQRRLSHAEYFRRLQSSCDAHEREGGDAVIGNEDRRVCVPPCEVASLGIRDEHMGSTVRVDAEKNVFVDGGLFLLEDERASAPNTRGTIVRVRDGVVSYRIEDSLTPAAHRIVGDGSQSRVLQDGAGRILELDGLVEMLTWPITQGNAATASSTLIPINDRVQIVSSLPSSKPLTIDDVLIVDGRPYLNIDLRTARPALRSVDAGKLLRHIQGPDKLPVLEVTSAESMRRMHHHVYVDGRTALDLDKNISYTIIDVEEIVGGTVRVQKKDAVVFIMRNPLAQRLGDCSDGRTLSSGVRCGGPQHLSSLLDETGRLILTSLIAPRALSFEAARETYGVGRKPYRMRLADFEVGALIDRLEQKLATVQEVFGEFDSRAEDYFAGQIVKKDGAFHMCMIRSDGQCEFMRVEDRTPLPTSSFERSAFERLSSAICELCMECARLGLPLEPTADGLGRAWDADGVSWLWGVLATILVDYPQRDWRFRHYELVGSSKQTMTCRLTDPDGIIERVRDLAPSRVDDRIGSLRWRDIFDLYSGIGPSAMQCAIGLRLVGAPVSLARQRDPYLREREEVFGSTLLDIDDASAKVATAWIEIKGRMRRAAFLSRYMPKGCTLDEYCSSVHKAIGINPCSRFRPTELDTARKRIASRDALILHTAVDEGWTWNARTGSICPYGLQIPSFWNREWRAPVFEGLYPFAPLAEWYKDRSNEFVRVGFGVHVGEDELILPRIAGSDDTWAGDASKSLRQERMIALVAPTWKSTVARIEATLESNSWIAERSHLKTTYAGVVTPPAARLRRGSVETIATVRFSAPVDDASVVRRMLREHLRSVVSAVRIKLLDGNSARVIMTLAVPPVFRLVPVPLVDALRDRSYHSVCGQLGRLCSVRSSDHPWIAVTDMLRNVVNPKDLGLPDVQAEDEIRRFALHWNDSIGGTRDTLRRVVAKSYRDGTAIKWGEIRSESRVERVAFGDQMTPMFRDRGQVIDPANLNVNASIFDGLFPSVPDERVQLNVIFADLYKSGPEKESEKSTVLLSRILNEIVPPWSIVPRMASSGRFAGSDAEIIDQPSWVQAAADRACTIAGVVPLDWRYEGAGSRAYPFWVGQDRGDNGACPVCCSILQPKRFTCQMCSTSDRQRPE